MTKYVIDITPEEAQALQRCAIVITSAVDNRTWNYADSAIRKIRRDLDHGPLPTDRLMP